MKGTEMVDRRFLDDNGDAKPPLEQARIVLSEMSDEMGNLPTRTEVERTNRRSDRNRNIAVALSMIIAIGAAIAVAVFVPRLVKVETTTALNTSSIEAYQEAIQQLRASGVPESQLPPPLPAAAANGEEVDVNSVVQAAAAIVLARVRTDPAYRGEPGGVGAAGAVGPPCDPVNPACRGPEGAVGTNGTNGIDGKDGTNGTNGLNGADGKDAPTPTSQAFVSDGNLNCYLQTNWSDGTNTRAATNSMLCMGG